MVEDTKKELISISFWNTPFLTHEQAENAKQVIADVLGLDPDDIDMELDDE
jgi:hypothetical protein